MNDDVLIAIINILPQLLLFAVLAGVVLALRRPLIERVLPRVAGVKVVGLELTLKPEDAQEVLSTAAARRKQPTPHLGVATSIVARAERNAEVLWGRQALWVDDHPDRNTAERFMLHSIGVFVDTAVANAPALAKLAAPGPSGSAWDVVISDIRRDSGTESGLDLRGQTGGIPLLYYVGTLDGPTPDGALGITNRPEELLHLVMDALERASSPDSRV
jgi:hypothetical protein